MAEYRREKGGSLYTVSRGQLIALAAGFTIASAIVFFLGIWIGRGIEERKTVKKEEPLVKIPAQPAPTAASAAPGGREETTFYDALAQGTARPEPERKEALKELREAKPAKTEAKETPAAPKAGTKAKSEAPAKSESKPAAKGERPYSVQVYASTNEKEAAGLAKKLKAKGYDAYVGTVEINEKTWYRVRVGRFASRDEAGKMQETLKTKEKLTKAEVRR